MSLYLVYIYYRRLFAKGDILTITILVVILGGSLYTLYQHYNSWSWVLALFLLSTFSHHNSREDLLLLKRHPQYRRILIGEYLIENLPFILLPVYKSDFLVAAGYLFGIIVIAFLPQRSLTLSYPFSLADPLWHSTFRKYKLLFFLPIIIGLIIIASVYKNPNLALFALIATGFVCCVPYFEREYPAHMSIAAQRGGDYLHYQLITGSKNAILFFCPIWLTYLIAFGTDNVMVLPICLGFPIVGGITKYAFFTHPLAQSLAMVTIFFGVLYILPLLVLPYLYYKAIQNIQSYQYVTDKSSGKEIPK
ncbi:MULTISPECIES: hypothetical protein [unclassified Capnocytophaga]|uniref:hypothetical protein n=1 Tax=unclassified Capnocytophaga TaxID=2640652 RepID=UPI000202FB32|nr:MULTISPECIES: hypothetical protein [unclassified Capnocytophaga]EGD35343.1 ABC superfamily ATP binding cassette transporter permease [Capnocytophaga sp. oral taxon 338 str. F0234]MEB3005329.1 ABC transporter permease [Capnocytophaga sp. G2]